MKIRLDLFKKYKQSKQIRVVAQEVKPKCQACCEACEEVDKSQQELKKQLDEINIYLDIISKFITDKYGFPPLKQVTKFENTKSLAGKLDKDEFIYGLIDEAVPKAIKAKND